MAPNSTITISTTNLAKRRFISTDQATCRHRRGRVGLLGRLGERHCDRAAKRCRVALQRRHPHVVFTRLQASDRRLRRAHEHSRLRLRHPERHSSLRQLPLEHPAIRPRRHHRRELRVLSGALSDVSIEIIRGWLADHDSYGDISETRYQEVDRPRSMAPVGEPRLGQSNRSRRRALRLLLEPFERQKDLPALALGIAASTRAAWTSVSSSRKSRTALRPDGVA